MINTVPCSDTRNENTQQDNGLSPYKARYPAIAIWWVPAKLQAEEIVNIPYSIRKQTSHTLCYSKLESKQKQKDKYNEMDTKCVNTPVQKQHTLCCSSNLYFLMILSRQPWSMLTWNVTLSGRMKVEENKDLRWHEDD